MSIDSFIASWPGRYGVYAKDLQNNRIVAFHEHEVFPSASLIKVPIMAEIFRRVEEERLILDETMIMHLEDQVPGSGVLIDLTPGLRISLRDLTILMITVSDNTATNMLIDFVGVDAVNTLMRRLGLNHTVLERRLERIPVERSNVNRTCAYDMSRLMELIARGELISVDASRRMVEILQRCQGSLSITPITDAETKTDFIGQKPRTRVAHKTGNLSNARHDSGIIYQGSRVCVVTLMSHEAPGIQLLKNIGRIGREVKSRLR